MSRFMYAWNFAPECNIYIHIEINFLKRCFEKYVHIHNFKCKPEYTGLVILVKLFTFVVFKTQETIWIWQVEVVDK